MGIQDSHGADEHLALKECLVDLNLARVVGFHQRFFRHHPLQKAFERRVFRKAGFAKGVKAVFTQLGFFLFLFFL